ncbi:MAG: four helix bundle suffix domain-containing protein, partial [Phycisphaerales bacterium]
YVEESPPDVAANTMVCLVNQANFLLDRQLESLERHFLNEGGFTERLYNARRQQRSHQSYPSHKSYPPKD